MEQRSHRAERKRMMSKVGPEIRELQTLEVGAALEKLRRRYAKHVVPIEEPRAMLDKALGELANRRTPSHARHLD